MTQDMISQSDLLKSGLCPVESIFLSLQEETECNLSEAVGLE